MYVPSSNFYIYIYSFDYSWLILWQGESGSLLGAQLFEPLPETHQNSSMDKYNSNSNSKNFNNLSMTVDKTDDQLENDISTLMDLTPPSSFSFVPIHHQYINQTNNLEHFNIPSLSNSISLGDLSDMPSSLVPVVGSNPIPKVYEDECKLSSYIQLTGNSVDPMLSPYLTYGGLSRPQFSHQDLEFHGVNGGLVLPDCMPRVSNNDLPKAPSAIEISSLEDPTYKVGKLSAEERQMRICRYKKKRNERNFSKKIKYACRKTLADTRPRVRGRFAKNDELVEMARTNGSNQEYDDTDEDASLHSSFMPDHQREFSG